LPYADLITI